MCKTNSQVIKLLEVDDQKHDPKHDPKRVFLSEEKDDNIIGSIISKVNIIYVAPNVSDAFILSSSSLILLYCDLLCCYIVKLLQLTPQEKAQLISKSDLYYDMSYSVAYSTFANMPAGNHI